MEEQLCGNKNQLPRKKKFILISIEWAKNFKASRKFLNENIDKKNNNNNKDNLKKFIITIFFKFLLKNISPNINTEECRNINTSMADI